MTADDRDTTTRHHCRLAGGAPATWWSRGYLPHFEQDAVPQMVTYRLADSMPATVLERWREELSRLPAREAETEFEQRVQRYLDAGDGACVLRQPRAASVVQRNLLHFDGGRYRLHAWVIMPNHVHVLLTPLPGHGLAKILHSWKSYTANAVNRVLGRRGRLWQREYFDRYIRNEGHFGGALEYIEANPVKASLCADPDDWPFSSAALCRRKEHSPWPPPTVTA